MLPIKVTDNDNVPGELFSHQAIFSDTVPNDTDPLFDFKASADPDTLYLHQAMKQPDHEKFRQAMRDEVNGHLQNDNFEVISKTAILPGSTLLPAVWQMKRKRSLATNEVRKYKARLNVDGSR